MRALLAIAILLAACDAYDEDLGPAPFYCGTDEPACPTGYDCVDDPSNGTKVCVASDDSISNTFDCDDDSDTEPNNMLAEATSSGLDGTKTYSIDNRAICPAGDKDVYAVMIATSGENVETTITYAGGAVLSGGILNTGGVTVAEALPTSESKMLRGYARNLPTGLYYVQVFAPPGAGSLAVNNYKLSIAITGP